MPVLMLTIRVAGLALLASACSEAEKPRTPCPPNRPAFHFELTAADGELPPDTRLNVQYNGTEEESYALGKRAPANFDVCCRPGMPSPEPLPHVSCREPQTVDAGAPRAVLCALWTNGDAEVKVRATGYKVLDRWLKANVPDRRCGVETVDKRLALTHGDGGL